MIAINVKTQKTSITAEVNGLITSGMVGIPVSIEYDSSWQGLIKTAFFRNGEFTRKQENVGTYTTIPWEVVRTTGILEIGLSGAKEDGSIVMPTVWCRVGTIKAGANSEIPAAPNPDYSVPESSGAIIDDTEISIAKVWSSLKTHNTINEQAEKFNSVFDETTVIGDNILDPDNSEIGSFSSTLVKDQPLTKIVNNGRTRSANPVAVTAGEKLYIFTSANTSKTNVTLYFLNRNYGYIDNTNINIPSDKSAAGKLEVAVPTDAAFMHLSIGARNSDPSVSFTNLCISRTQLNEFASFVSKTEVRVKEESLPEGYPELPKQVKALSDKVNGLGKEVSAPKLQGKVVVNFGDSIFGLRRPPNDISTKLAELTGATVYNCGFSGCTMAWHGSGTSANPSYTNYDPFSMYRLVDEIAKPNDDPTKWVLQENAIASYSSLPSYYPETLQILKDLDFSAVDIVTIAYGTNDFTRVTTIENASDLYKTTTFAGALRYSIEKLLSAYPHLRIFLCSQTFRFWIKDGEVSNTSDSYVNTKENKLIDFVEKTEAVAKEYHLPYINNYDIGLNIYNRSYYFSETDGTHPLTAGLHVIAANMANKMF